MVTFYESVRVPKRMNLTTTKILRMWSLSAVIDYSHNGSFLRGSFVYLGGCSTNLMEILNKLSSLKRWKTFEMGKRL
jgi:hypothetical protein